ncbi:hypothetical protein N136_02792 [Leifsonia aquatica ATCC 14665]|uniref:Uncharacterized protein n=1 Tax=Leifsonia aquatica ATCC 14665 TaxID=1358026 RepID=U2R6K1_LEIAQ|nr:hypothetical protein N136_02792 [Leifsonia aquatica ATCC 14665]
MSQWWHGWEVEARRGLLRSSSLRLAPAHGVRQLSARECDEREWAWDTPTGPRLQAVRIRGRRRWSRLPARR